MPKCYASFDFFPNHVKITQLSSCTKADSGQNLAFRANSLLAPGLKQRFWAQLSVLDSSPGYFTNQRCNLGKVTEPCWACFRPVKWGWWSMSVVQGVGKMKHVRASTSLSDGHAAGTPSMWAVNIAAGRLEVSGRGLWGWRGQGGRRSGVSWALNDLSGAVTEEWKSWEVRPKKLASTSLKILQIANAGEGVEKREPSYTVGRM